MVRCRAVFSVRHFGLFLIAAALAAACGERTTPRDFSAEADRICRDYCAMNVACHEPAIFEQESECREVCLDNELLFEDSECGASRRAGLDCVAQTETCADYRDTNNVNAETYTCQVEKLAFVELQCGSADADE